GVGRDEAAVDELALAVDRAAARRIPLPGRQLEDVAAVEAVGALDQPLAVRRLADDDGAIVVLQRAGHDLGGRGGPLVEEYDERHVRRDRLVGREVLELAVAPLPVA